uniref:Uncharacterized protein n=1 Tax=Romanomermis culicivorax TaxID=13658 RepID=A0A915KXG2_ROMCU
MNENSETAEIWWFKDEDVPDYRAHLERELKALKDTYKIHSLLCNKIKAYLLKCIEDGLMNVGCPNELWSLTQREMALDNGETIIFASSNDEEMVEKHYGFKMIYSDNESSTLSSNDSTEKTSPSRRRKPRKDARKEPTKS